MLRIAGRSLQVELPYKELCCTAPGFLEMLSSTAVTLHELVGVRIAVFIVYCRWHAIMPPGLQRRS
jgi:hypothetical protein